MFSPALIKWLEEHPENLFDNGKGTTIIVNNPGWASAELMHGGASDFKTNEYIDMCAMIATTDLPQKKRQGRGKLSTEDVLAIRNALDNGETTIAVAQRFGVTRVTISQIKNGHTWK